MYAGGLIAGKRDDVSAHMLVMTTKPATLRGALELLAANAKAVAAHAYFGLELDRLLQSTADGSLQRDAAALAARWAAFEGVPVRRRHISRHFASDVNRAIRDTRRP